MRNLISLLCLTLTLSTIAQSEIENIFKEIRLINERFAIDNPVWRGEHPKSYPILDLEQVKLKTELLRTQLKKLENLTPADLSSQDRINRSVRILQLTDAISRVDFNMNLITINAEGGRFSSPVFFLSRLPFETAEDFNAYINWLPSFADFINQEKSMLQDGLKNGVILPKVIVKNTLAQLEEWIKIDSSPFLNPLAKIPDTIDEKSQNGIEKDLKKVLEAEVIPAYKNLYDFISKKYLQAAPEEVGVSEMRNGKKFYENRVKHFTTLNMSPDSVFSLGQSEVSRIKGLMNEIIQEVQFDGTFTEFIEFLRTDQQFYADTPEELLSRAAWLSKKAEGQLPKLFSELYELPYTVEPVPDNIAPTYTAGRYVHGSWESKEPGIYWVNTYSLSSRSLYTLPALTVHEAVPGHHLQTMIAAELEGLPDFRTTYYISAFGEGWGLYSEFLGEEMGMYSTPYEWFGRYTYEMWRACRLVVDVGLHYKGWTRQEAIDFMASNTALSMHEVNTEIDRYIGWPGQAVSYKIGELTIKALRKNAETTLGEGFDIQAFHKVILSNGSIPLTDLQEEVESWIKSKNEK